MFGIGGFELFIILLFGFLVFGPDKLPEMAKTLGMALRKFKDAQAEMESVIKDEVLDIDGNGGKKNASSKKPAPASSGESFAERKARYDKERAERRKQQIEKNRAALKQKAAEEAKAAEAAEEAAAPAAAEASTEAAPAAEPAAEPAKPALTPDELFGTKPIKPGPGSAAKAEAAPAATEGGE